VLNLTDRARKFGVSSIDQISASFVDVSEGFENPSQTQREQAATITVSDSSSIEVNEWADIEAEMPEDWSNIPVLLKLKVKNTKDEEFVYLADLAGSTKKHGNYDGIQKENYCMLKSTY
jgi:hypothetical protein